MPVRNITGQAIGPESGNLPGRRGYAYSCYLHSGMNGTIVVGQAAATPVTAPAPAAPAPAALASSSTASGGIDFRPLVLGGLGGAVFGATAARRLKPGRSRA
ncbi:MAG: cupredoxin domain-containing protein [Acidimicrobiia bacterium]